MVIDGASMIIGEAFMIIDGATMIMDGVDFSGLTFLARCCSFRKSASTHYK